MIKIGVLVNGGAGIGMGHIMRCLSLADEFKVNNCDICFISIVADGIETIRSSGYSVIDPGCKSQEGKNNLTDLENGICEVLEKYMFDVLIVDSYDVTSDLFIRLKRRVGKLVYIDDLNAFTYPADILINGNISAEKISYKRYFSDEIVLIGHEYNLIRQEFRDLPVRNVKDEVKDILITSGGSDPYKICHKIATMLLSDKNLAELQLKIVIGKSFADLSDLFNLAIQYPVIKLYREPESMSKLMQESDIAVSSAGSTLYELCACGVPALSFIMAQNQAGLAENMDKQGLIKCLGWYDMLTKENICSNIMGLLSDKNKRAGKISAMQKCVDGYGTRRVVERILKII